MAKEDDWPLRRHFHLLSFSAYPNRHCWAFQHPGLWDHKTSPTYLSVRLQLYNERLSVLQYPIRGRGPALQRRDVRIVTPRQDPRFLEILWQEIPVAEPADTVLVRRPRPQGVSVQAMNGNDTITIKNNVFSQGSHTRVQDRDTL